MPKPSDALISALKKAGIADDLTQRVIIDIPCDGYPKIYIEKLGDKNLLDVLPAVVDSPYEIIHELEKEGDL